MYRIIKSTKYRNNTKYKILIKKQADIDILGRTSTYPHCSDPSVVAAPRAKNPWSKLEDIRKRKGSNNLSMAATLL